ncbi:MAG: aminotransferase class V-fold PLP-dependent enzyme [bacterium]
MTETFDIQRARAETRACENLIHFNNAGSSLMPAPVVDYLCNFLKLEESIGGYESVEREAAALDNFYHATARMLNCNAGEVAYAENATRAWDMAFYGLSFNPGDRILTTISEYGSNVIAYNQQAERYGVEVVFVPDDQYGQIDVEALRRMVDDRVKLISISLIPTGGGLVNPAMEVGKVARDAGIPYLLDACQAVGQLPLDVEAIGCDMLSATGRKFLRGPRGTGFLYVRSTMMDRLIPPFLDQHSADLISPGEYRMAEDARRFENWEQYFAGKAALGVSIDYAMDWGLVSIRDRVFFLAETLRTRLSEIDGVQLTDQGQVKCGIVTFAVAQQDAYQIKSELHKRKINVSVSDGSGNLVSFQQRGIEQVVRSSVHYFNTIEEIDIFINALKEILTLN